jgi:hypothetical protein
MLCTIAATTSLGSAARLCSCSRLVIERRRPRSLFIFPQRKLDGQRSLICAWSGKDEEAFELDSEGDKDSSVLIVVRA